LVFYLALQIKQRQNGIFVNQEIYGKDPLKKYNMNEENIMVTSMHPSSSLDKDKNGKQIYEK
jgi:hypothetical protein